MRAHLAMMATALLLAAPVASAQTRQSGQPPASQAVFAAASAESVAQTSSDGVARLAAVQRHLDAYRSGDIDQFVATFTPDAIVRADGYVAIGHDQIRALYQLNFAPDAPSIRVHESGLNGDKVYLSVGYVFAENDEICCSYSEYEITDGKVSFLVTG